MQAQAQKDVELTNATLKEADDIYKTLKGMRKYVNILFFPNFIYLSWLLKNKIFFLYEYVMAVYWLPHLSSIIVHLEFSDQVTESRQLAEQAALDVPGVQMKVAAADANITSITDELTAASDKAKEARDLAQQAQNDYANKASEVNLTIN